MASRVLQRRVGAAATTFTAAEAKVVTSQPAASTRRLLFPAAILPTVAKVFGRCLSQRRFEGGAEQSRTLYLQPARRASTTATTTTTTAGAAATAAAAQAFPASLGAFSTTSRASRTRGKGTRSYATSAKAGVGAWDDLPDSERTAWQALGWSADAWHRRKAAPVSSWKHWHELTPGEQAAAKYGLGFSETSWDKRLDEDLHEDESLAVLSSTNVPAEAPPTKAPAGLAGTGSDVASREAPAGAVGQLLSLGKMSLPWLRAVTQFLPRGSPLRAGAEFLGAVAAGAEEAAHGIVTITDVEEVIYLDDSGSMHGSRLMKAQALWQQMAKSLQESPARVIKFGTHKHVLQSRTTGFPVSAISLGWNAQSGATYMWHMILEDIKACYAPGPGRLRVFVFTDGHDTHSPEPYAGMKGMDALMKELISLGYNVEFHIVFVSDAGDDIMGLASTVLGSGTYVKDREAMLARYQDLALATGGGFFHLTGASSEEDAREAFLERIDSGSRSDVAAARREYERRLESGQGTNFDWYKALPPPPKG